MKFINQNDIMMFLEKPITRLSVFEIETIDAMLSMCEPAFIKMQEDFKVRIDFATFKFQLLKTMGEFLNKCDTCSEECLSNPHKHVEAKRYEQNHIDSTRWPTRLQKTTQENFFIMEYCITYADILFRYLLDAGIEKQAAHVLSEQAMLELAKWIEQNCIRKCNYECLRRYRSMGYCTLCSYMIQPLPCPKKQEIKPSVLGMQEEDFMCRREESPKKKVMH